MVALRKPRALRPGATIGIAAPGGPVQPELLEVGAAQLRDAGFAVHRRDDLLARLGYLAGDDERRVSELMELVTDPQVDAIVCARGGYGCDRILHRLDAEAFRVAAKPLVGYSDITALLLWQARCAGLAGIHGPMLDRGEALEPKAFRLLLQQLTGEVELPLVLRGRPLGGGRGEGPLVGGSLTLLAASLGTSWEVETAGAVLLLEDVAEAPYRIDRMLQQLRGAGKLEGLEGLGFGDFSSCQDVKYGSQVEDVLAEQAEVLGVPCVLGLPFGHVDCNTAWPFGGRATIDGDRGELCILERGVEVAA